MLIHGATDRQGCLHMWNRVQAGVGDPAGEDRNDGGLTVAQGQARLPHLFERENRGHVHLDAAVRQVADDASQALSLRRGDRYLDVDVLSPIRNPQGLVVDLGGRIGEHLE